MALQTENKDKNYQCPECPKFFSRNKYLKLHSDVHKTEKPFRCEVCLKDFPRLARLNRHKKTHVDKTPSKCSRDEESSATSSQLEKHIEKSVARFECTICKKIFQKKIYLRKHCIVHKIRKTLSCNICSKKFTWKGNLIRHTKSLHSGVAAESLSLPQIETYSISFQQALSSMKNDFYASHVVGDNIIKKENMCATKTKDHETSESRIDFSRQNKIESENSAPFNIKEEPKNLLDLSIDILFKAFKHKVKTEE